jgi:hypothetical protein
MDYFRRRGGPWQVSLKLPASRSHVVEDIFLEQADFYQPNRAPSILERAQHIRFVEARRRSSPNYRRNIGPFLLSDSDHRVSAPRQFPGVSVSAEEALRNHR